MSDAQPVKAEAGKLKTWSLIMLYQIYIYLSGDGNC